MKTIAIALQKGGTGKTVLSVSLAAALARQVPGRVLLVDCDPQGNSTEWTHPDELRAELATVLLGKCALRDAVAEAEFSGLCVLPTAGLDGELKVWDEGAGTRRPFAMWEIVKGAAAMGFKFCVLDLSPGFGAIERAALVSADEVITPIMPDPFGISGLEIFTQNLLGLRKDLDTEKSAYRRIIIKAVDNRIKQHGEIVAGMRDKAGEFRLYVFPVDQVFRRAETEHKSIYDTGTAKKETLDELNRLATEAGEG
ncbi:MAG: ParA family protein [Spirochaetaceae bacterium]|nr:ParA family protein [Spirochaetaceae bacterium]